jgi:hypothetical protein
MGGGGSWEVMIGAASCRVAPRVWGSRVGGWDSVQGTRGGHPRHQRCRGGAAAMGPALASPLPRVSRWGTGKTPGRKEIRSDRMGPHGSERRRKVGDSWAGWLCWAARIGGLAVCAGLRCKMEGVLQTSTYVVKAQSGREGFPYFLST